MLEVDDDNEDEEEDEEQDDELALIDATPLGSAEEADEGTGCA